MWSIYIIRLKVKLKILYQYIIYRQFTQFSQYRQFSHNNLKEEKWKVFMEAVACWIKKKEKKQKQNIIRIKETTPDQNAINLTSTELLESQLSLLRKEHRFYQLRQISTGMKFEETSINLLINYNTEWLIQQR